MKPKLDSNPIYGYHGGQPDDRRDAFGDERAWQQHHEDSVSAEATSLSTSPIPWRGD